MLGKTVAIVTEGVGENTNKVFAGGAGGWEACVRRINRTETPRPTNQSSRVPKRIFANTKMGKSSGFEMFFFLNQQSCLHRMSKAFLMASIRNA